MHVVRTWSGLLLLSLTTLCAGADDTTSSDKPVKVVADHVLHVVTAKGAGDLPLYISSDGAAADWSKPQPGVTQALIVLQATKLTGSALPALPAASPSRANPSCAACVVNAAAIQPSAASPASSSRCRRSWKTSASPAASRWSMRR